MGGQEVQVVPSPLELKVLDVHGEHLLEEGVVAS